MFVSIVRSNGWDDATVALQLLSHLEGDALNVALLVPEVKMSKRVGLVGALVEHYGSPGRLADYREGETHRYLPWRWKHLRDFDLYGTGSSLVMRTVLCDDIWIVFHQRRPFEILWTTVGYGERAVGYGTRAFGGS